MPVSDQIGDFITRIRNAGTAGHKTVEAPTSKVKVGIAEILKEQGYIEEYENIDEGVQGTIKVTLKYYRREPVEEYMCLLTNCQEYIMDLVLH